MFKAIIFDMDGVVIDSEPLWEKSEKILISNLGLNYNPLYRDKIVGLNQEDSATLIRDTFNLKMDNNELIRERLKILKKLYNNELKLIEGIRQLLADCELNNLKIGLASSSPMNIIEFILEKFELKNHFRSVVSGECTKSGKPEPDIYIEASKQLSVNTSECIAVEDSINGVIAAKSAGIYCIAVPDKRLSIEKYKQADQIVYNIADIKIEEII